MPRSHGSLVSTPWTQTLHCVQMGTVRREAKWVAVMAEMKWVAVTAETLRRVPGGQVRQDTCGGSEATATSHVPRGFFLPHVRPLPCL